MRTGSKYDLTKLRDQFVRSDLSLRALCRENGIEGFSYIAQIAKRDNWLADRAQYRQEAKDKTIERMAENQAEIAVQMRGEMLTVVRAALYKFAEDLKRPDFLVSPSDIVKLIQQGMLLIGDPTSRTEEKSFALTAELGELPPEVLRELAGAARQARLVGQSGGGPAPLLPPGSRAN